LLSPERPQQHQFIGAQVIFKKIETHFDQIATKDAQVVELRNILYQLLPSTFGKKVVMDRLCMAISLLALKTTNTCWTTSIQNFVTSGSESAEQCYISLMLLKHFTQLFDTHIHERREKKIAEEFVRENLKLVLDFLA
jgi:hypothetical protein